MEKDIKNNVVYVSRNYFSVDKKRRLFRVGSLRWLSGLLPRQINELQCKVNLSFSLHFNFFLFNISSMTPLTYLRISNVSLICKDQTLRCTLHGTQVKYSFTFLDSCSVD